MKIFLYESNRQLLIYSLITKIENKDLVICFDNMDQNIYTKLQCNSLVIEIRKIKKKTSRIVQKIKLEKKLENILKNKEYKVYGYDHTFLSNIYFSNKEIILIEDGSINYMKIKKPSFKNKIYFYIKKILFLNERKNILGYDSTIKKIYLTGLTSIPEEIAHKVEIINLKELWDKKTLEEQNEILDIFSFDSNIKEKIKGKDMILFTQPLSEDKILTEEEKIEIYSKIIKKYPKDRLVIKTHPREKTDYKNIFKEYLILDNPFPFEILNLLDVKFTKAITLFSTAALGLGKNVETDFYGTEIHPKIFDRFGSCDNIMKRNCFLKEEK